MQYIECAKGEIQAAIITRYAISKDSPPTQTRLLSLLSTWSSTKGKGGAVGLPKEGL